MFNLGNFNILYIVIAIMVLSSVSGFISNPESLVSLLLTIPGVLIAITFHEFAHAYAADKLGDDTPRLQGRLSLNPLAHLDPVGSILLLVAGFGWGKPVQINPRNFNRTVTMSKGEAIVSIAGPLMNFTLSIIFSIIYALVLKYVTVANTFVKVLVYVLQYTIMINIGLGVFNLIPLPPLDGSKILKNFLPYDARAWFENKEHVFYIVFVVLWISGLAGQIITPAINGIWSLLLKLINLIV